jgi:hypothetical protein
MPCDLPLVATIISASHCVISIHNVDHTFQPIAGHCGQIATLLGLLVYWLPEIS